MTKIALKLLLCFFLTSTFCHGQIKMLLLSGKTKVVKQYEIKGEWVFYKKPNDPKDKLRKMDKFDVFSAINPDGSEEIIYDPDTVFEGDPAVGWVRNYIKGEQYAITKYHTQLNKFGGFLVGAGTGAIAGYYSPIGVFIYSMGRNIFKPKIPHSDSIDPLIFNSEEFQLGYRKYVRNKRIKQSLLFGGLGIFAGMAALEIEKSTDDDIPAALIFASTFAFTTFIILDTECNRKKNLGD